MAKSFCGLQSTFEDWASQKQLQMAEGVLCLRRGLWRPPLVLRPPPPAPPHPRLRSPAFQRELWSAHAETGSCCRVVRLRIQLCRLSEPRLLLIYHSTQSTNLLFLALPLFNNSKSSSAFIYRCGIQHHKALISLWSTSPDLSHTQVSLIQRNIFLLSQPGFLLLDLIMWLRKQYIMYILCVRSYIIMILLILAPFQQPRPNAV